MQRAGAIQIRVPRELGLARYSLVRKVRACVMAEAEALTSPPTQEDWRGVVEQISWTPRAFLYRKFLSEEECDELIKGVSRSTCTRPSN